ncbi:MAG: Fic family protein [Magnetococcales bacterium]|nr:Fic family protein [Magnetococcales bacterium]
MSVERVLLKEELTALREKLNQHLRQTNEPNPLQSLLQQLYPDTSERAVLLAQLDDLKQCLDSFRPFHPQQVENLLEALTVKYTYESNRIEGNSLTLSETRQVLDHGLTIGGKPLKDHLEATNHHQAIGFLQRLVKQKEPLTERILLEIHAIILNGIDRENAGFYRRMNVHIAGSIHICPNHLKVPELMEDYFSFYTKTKSTKAKSQWHPVELASAMHLRLVTIHPFIDGNGRCARLIMNLILMQNGFPITIISANPRERNAYYDALEQSHSQDNHDDFTLLIGRCVKEGFFRYLDTLAINGEPSEEEKGRHFFRRLQEVLP